MTHRFPLLVAVIAAILPVALHSADWKPIEPAQLALKSPKLDPHADAEVVLWEVRMRDQFQGDEPQTELFHYLRIKIYTDKGRDEQAKVDLTYTNFGAILDLAGRTIQPNGSIVELKKDAIFDRSLVKASGLKVKAKSFAMPAVEPGAIIEYRWRELRYKQIINYVRLHFQREIPVWSIQYHIKPLEDAREAGYVMRTLAFQCQAPKFEREPDGFYTTTMKDVPAFREEPMMPPENNIRAWLLLYYAKVGEVETAKYWREVGKEKMKELKLLLKADDSVKKRALELTADATSPMDKLVRLADFCRRSIKNISYEASGVTVETREIILRDKTRTPEDTLRRGMGTGRDVNMLFAALATAAGFDAHVALLPDRSDTYFDPTFADDYFLTTYNIAVRIDGAWKFFDPASFNVPTGMLRWQEEGVSALITDSKEPAWATTPMSEPSKSQIKRTAKLRLSEDGTLEGDVESVYWGHSGTKLKNREDSLSPAEREEALRKSLQRRLSTAELSDVKIENVLDPDNPYSLKYHVRIPGYAERTGRRLFFQPAYFQRGIGALFPTNERKYDLSFEHAWSEDDRVEIELPDGFALDHASAPAPGNLGGIGSYDVKLELISKERKTLRYTRRFVWGNGGQVMFSKEHYGPLKNAFDWIHEQDNHALALKQETPQGAAQ